MSHVLDIVLMAAFLSVHLTLLAVLFWTAFRLIAWLYEPKRPHALAQEDLFESRPPVHAPIQSQVING